jgi:hypothetical protein
LLNICVPGGKLAQRVYTARVRVISDGTELCKLFYTPGIIVCDIVVLNRRSVLVMTTTPEELCEPARNSNMLVASFVTAYGRCMLYHPMNSVNKDLCYVDTGKKS